MSKKIIFCADGTWNHPGDPAQVLPSDTNVYKFFKGLKICPDQLPFYDDGVGSNGQPIDRLLGGALGAGLFQKIKDGYTFLAHAFNPGDEVFLIGFSRGAYTARSLAGMLAACGLPDKSKLSSAAVEDAFAAYRLGAKRQTAVNALEQKYGNQDVSITMVGVWDTVGALGLPGVLFEAFDAVKYGFLDTKLNSKIAAAYQALSIDSRRPEFAPTLWDTPAQTPGGPQQTMEQVWFAGVHCDVGGGYLETGLSDISLAWMTKKAAACGLDFDETFLSKYQAIEEKHSLDALHDSWNPLWGYPKARHIPDGATISKSVAVRIAELQEYRPRNLKINSSVLDGSYQLDESVFESL